MANRFGYGQLKPKAVVGSFPQNVLDPTYGDHLNRPNLVSRLFECYGANCATGVPYHICDLDDENQRDPKLAGCPEWNGVLTDSTIYLLDDEGYMHALR
jgi:hypothetical protein